VDESERLDLLMSAAACGVLCLKICQGGRLTALLLERKSGSGASGRDLPAWQDSPVCSSRLDPWSVPSGERIKPASEDNIQAWEPLWAWSIHPAQHRGDMRRDRL